MSYSIDCSPINTHQIFIGCLIKEMWHRKHISSCKVHEDSIKCVCIYLHVWQGEKRFHFGCSPNSLSISVKTHIFSASTLPQSTLPTSTFDNYLVYFPAFHSTTPQRTGVNLLHPAELCILYVWVEAAITIEIVRARELNFSTQEKMSHTPTQNTASLVARCRWRNRHLCFFSGLFLNVLLLLEDGEPRKKLLAYIYVSFAII